MEKQFSTLAERDINTAREKNGLLVLLTDLKVRMCAVANLLSKPKECSVDLAFITENAELTR